jgi:predicted O-methyltransferase YrrM
MTSGGRAWKGALMEVCEAVEQTMASAKPFGDDCYILDQMRDGVIQRLEQLAPDLPAAAELLDAVAHSPTGDNRRLFAETTLRSAIGHAYKHLTSGAPRGPRLLRLTDCTAIMRAAARYVEHGGTDTPLQDGSLVALGPKPHHGWIWRDEHPDDAYGRALRELVIERYGLLPSTPDAADIEMLQSGARLLEELLPSLAPSALHHAHLVACLPASRLFIGSGSRSDLPGMFFLRQSLGTPWWIAESLLHESIHSKLYDLVAGHSLVRSDDGTRSIPVVIPWRPSRLSGENRFRAQHALTAFHVYVHLALLSTVAERRAPELEATYGPLSGMIESHRARARARYLGRQLHAQPLCWEDLGAIRQQLADWLSSLLDMLDPAPPPDGSTLHLYLDLYHRETDQLEQALAEPTERLRTRSPELTALARQDVASTRAILRDLDADQQVAKLDAAVVGFADAELADSYPQIRRVVETCLIDASLDGYRMSLSGEHDAMVGEIVGSASDALFALSIGIPAPVAHAKRRGVAQRFAGSCDDDVGRLLALQAAHLPTFAKVLEIGTGVGVATAWLVAGLGSRTDVDILSVEADATLGATARSYRWPSFVRIETANVETALADHASTFDLILADASASTLDHVDAMVDASRSGGMLIFFHHAGVDAAAASEPGDAPLSALRQTVLDHDKLVAADIDWCGGLLIAAKRP